MEVVGIDRISLDETARAEIGLSAYVCRDISAEGLAACGTPSIIVHCAGGASIGASNLHPALDFTDTVSCFNILLEYCRTNCPDTRLIYISSAAIYGSGYSEPIAEDSDSRPISPYGLHKNLCEQMLQFYGRRDGLKGVCVRPFSVYGPGLRKQLLWDAVRKLSTGQATFSGSGEEQRDWVHIEDVAALLVLAARHASPVTPICNAATQIGVSVRDILGLLTAVIDPGQKLVFDGIQRDGDPEYLVGSADIAQSWGWTPRVSWRGGISDYVRWALNAIAI